jgi:hypothetical protein
MRFLIDREHRIAQPLDRALQAIVVGQIPPKKTMV